MLHIPAHDHGALYILELVRPVPDDMETKSASALAAIFGDVTVNPDYVDVVRPGLLEGMTLPDLIRNGYDMTLTDAQAAELQALFGAVALVGSAAFGGRELTIDLPADVRPVMVLRDAPTMTAPASLTSDAAKGALAGGKPVKSDARIGGMVATVVLLLLFALVGLMVWISA